MIKVGVPGISTLLEPSTAATATTEFAGFRDNAAFGACSADDGYRCHWHSYVGIGHNTVTVLAWLERESIYMPLTLHVRLQA